MWYYRNDSFDCCKLNLAVSNKLSVSHFLQNFDKIKVTAIAAIQRINFNKFYN